MKPLESSQIDALLPFRDKFEDSKFSAGEWIMKEGHFPWFKSHQVVREFLEVLYENNWVTPEFDWTEWQESAAEHVENREMVEAADIATIQKLFTTHARKDRFSEGHLASMFDNGHIPALLRRLQVLRARMGQENGNDRTRR